MNQHAPIPAVPCLPESLRQATLASLPDHPLIRPTPEGPVIGYLIDYTAPDAYKALAPQLNVEIAEAFPLLYNALSTAFFSIGRSPVFPNSLSLPAILPAGPISTKLPATYLDLSSGLLVLQPPAGACLQFHLVHQNRVDAIFS